MSNSFLLPSLPGYLQYMADWTQGPESPFLSLLTHGPATHAVFCRMYPNFKDTVRPDYT